MRKRMHRIGISGSRKRNDPRTKALVGEAIAFEQGKHPDAEIWVITGDAKGPDTFGLDYAHTMKLSNTSHIPDRSQWHIKGPQLYYERNEQIVLGCDILYAFVHESRTGGTENTIKWANKHNVPVVIVE